MEPPNSTAETAGTSKSYRAITIVVAAGATLLVFAAIVGHWTTYDWLRKILAVILLLSLLLGLALRHKSLYKTRQERERVSEALLQQAYVWLMIVTTLFAFAR